MGETAAHERPVLALSRHYPARREKVWRAWTDPQALSRWFGPGDTECVLRTELDVREGGRYHIAFRTDDGEQHDVSGVYQVVDAPRKLSFTWAWKSTPDRVSLVTVEFAEEGGGTRMDFRHERFFDAQARDNHRRGWTATLDKLGAALADTVGNN